MDLPIGAGPICVLILALASSSEPCLAADYPSVDTGQDRCYNNTHEIRYPTPGDAFFGQDAQYRGAGPSYRDNGDGTVTDLVTGLMWQKDPGPKKAFRQALAGARACRLGGHRDWRLPSIKELYSLIVFSGVDPDPRSMGSPELRPFVDTDYFVFRYGDASRNERIIDSQYASATKYVSTTMHGDETVFGVNFADGRIKGYGLRAPHGRGEKTFYVMYVRGNPDYGKNRFRDNGDGTVTDRATGLSWMKGDSGHLRAGQNKDGRLSWEQALAWAERLEYAGHSDWRLPNVKELQSIVDYTRSPATSGSPAIDPVFDVTAITDEAGHKDYPFYWSSTTHARLGSGEAAAYVAFGRSPGWMPDFRRGYSFLDVHGAGSQRSDPKAGDPRQFPRGRGPQGDVIRIYNFARAVRSGQATPRTSGPELETVMPQLGRPGPGMGPSQGKDPGSVPPFVPRLDRNRDGKVSRSEFDGPAHHFDRLDRDHDGYLSEDEAPPPPPPGNRPGRRRPGGPPGRQ